MMYVISHLYKQVYQVFLQPVSLRGSCVSIGQRSTSLINLGLCEKIGVPTGKPRAGHGENMQSSHKKPPA